MTTAAYDMASDNDPAALGPPPPATTARTSHSRATAMPSSVPAAAANKMILPSVLTDDEDDLLLDEDARDIQALREGMRRALASSVPSTNSTSGLSTTIKEVVSLASRIGSDGGAPAAAAVQYNRYSSVPFPIMRLPDDMLYQCFRFLPAQDLGHVSEVSRVFLVPAADALNTCFEEVFGEPPKNVSRKTCIRFLKRAQMADESTKECFAVFMWACSRGYIKFLHDRMRHDYVLRMADRGGLNATTKINGMSALHLAAQHGQSQVVEFLLRNGADPTKLCRNGKSIGHLAAQRGMVNILKIMHEMGGTEFLIQHRDEARKTALYQAAEYGHAHCVRYICEIGGSVDDANNEEKTSLYVASERGYDDVVEQLLRFNADVTLTARTGKTPLFIAAERGYETVVARLLAAGSDVRHQSARSKTPLYVAAESSHLLTCEILLEYSKLSDMFQVNKYGTTPMYIAAKQPNRDVVNVFLRFCLKHQPGIPEGEKMTTVAGRLERAKPPRFIEEVKHFFKFVRPGPPWPRSRPRDLDKLQPFKAASRYIPKAERRAAMKAAASAMAAVTGGDGSDDDAEEESDDAVFRKRRRQARSRPPAGRSRRAGKLTSRHRRSNSADLLAKASADAASRQAAEEEANPAPPRRGRSRRRRPARSREPRIINGPPRASGTATGSGHGGSSPSGASADATGDDDDDDGTKDDSVSEPPQRSRRIRPMRIINGPESFKQHIPTPPPEAVRRALSRPPPKMRRNRSAPEKRRSMVNVPSRLGDQDGGDDDAGSIQGGADTEAVLDGGESVGNNAVDEFAAHMVEEKGSDDEKPTWDKFHNRTVKDPRVDLGADAELSGTWKPGERDAYMAKQRQRIRDKLASLTPDERARLEQRRRAQIERREEELRRVREKREAIEAAREEKERRIRKRFVGDESAEVKAKRAARALMAASADPATLQYLQKLTEAHKNKASAESKREEDARALALEKFGPYGAPVSNSPRRKKAAVQKARASKARRGGRRKHGLHAYGLVPQRRVNNNDAIGDSQMAALARQHKANLRQLQEQQQNDSSEYVRDSDNSHFLSDGSGAKSADIRTGEHMTAVRAAAESDLAADASNVAASSLYSLSASSRPSSSVEFAIDGSEDPSRVVLVMGRSGPIVPEATGAFDTTKEEGEYKLWSGTSVGSGSGVGSASMSIKQAPLSVRMGLSGPPPDPRRPPVPVAKKSEPLDGRSDNKENSPLAPVTLPKVSLPLAPSSQKSVSLRNMQFPMQGNPAPPPTLPFQRKTAKKGGMRMGNGTEQLNQFVSTASSLSRPGSASNGVGHARKNSLLDLARQSNLSYSMSLSAADGWASSSIRKTMPRPGSSSNKRTKRGSSAVIAAAAAAALAANHQVPCRNSDGMYQLGRGRVPVPAAKQVALPIGSVSVGSGRPLKQEAPDAIDGVNSRLMASALHLAATSVGLHNRNIH